MPKKDLIHKYLLHERGYWQEIIHQLNGPLATKAGQFPDFYRHAGNLLIFPAVDGIVTVCFDKEFRFRDPQFDSWLSDAPKDKGPFCSIVESSLSGKLSISQWTQALTGNGIKLIVDGVIPTNVNIKGAFPQFPSPTVHDPVKGTVTPMTLLNFEISGSISDFAFGLKEVSIEELETGRRWRPFLWRQLDIFGEDALKRLTEIDGQLKASRELIAILGAINLGLTEAQFAEKPYTSVIEIMREIIKGFELRLKEEGDHESPLHEYLKENPILLAPDYLDCISHPNLGKELQPDFIITERSDYGPQCILIEIEHAEHKLFTKLGRPTKELTHGLSQIRDWREWLRKNASYAQNSLDLENLHADCRALLIIGRRSNLNKSTAKKLEALTLDMHHQTIVLTYDQLLDRARQWNDNLKEMASLTGK